MTGTAARPTYSRKDLKELKAWDRAHVFEALGSFDERSCSEEVLIRKTAELLDPGRVPGLDQVMRDSNASAIAQTILDACRRAYPPAGSPSASSAEIRTAEDALAHRFTFYDEPHQLPEDIDWDFNPGTAHWGHDLNRFSYLHPLTGAYRTTHDGRFARKAVDLILDWIRKSDFGRAFIGSPYVFGSYLNQAVHCSVWCDSIQQLLPEGQVTPVETVRILKSIHDHLAYLEIVTNGDGGNWPTIGCQGMLAALGAFPLFRDTERFVTYGIRTLAAQVEDQVLPDGVQDELTPHYHRCVVDNLLRAVGNLGRTGRRLEPRTLATLRKMIHYLQQTVVPDGSAQVAFNDSDPAAVPDVPGDLERVGLQEFLSPPERLAPELFPFAGVAFLRQRPSDGDLYLAFDGGPYGRSHQHEDKLGFWLFAYGRNLLVDPGRHLYDWSSASYLAHLRSTRAHSTITVDGEGQHSVGRPETWVSKTPVPMAWNVRDGEVRASAAYDLGYGPKNTIQVVHRREIVFVKERLWVVFDRVEGDGTHRLDSRFQFAPAAVRLEGSRAWTCYEHGNLLLWSVGSAAFSDARLEVGQENPRSGWYSKRYARIEPAPCLVFTANVRLPFIAATLLFPYRDASPPSVTFAFDGSRATVLAPGLASMEAVTSLPAHKGLSHG